MTGKTQHRESGIPQSRVAAAGLAVALLLTCNCLFRNKPKPPAPAPVPASTKMSVPQPQPTVPAEPPPAIVLHPPPSGSAPVAPPPVAPTPRALLEADDKFAIGNYSGAVQDYEKFLGENPDHPERAAAIFRLGVAYAISGSSAREQRAAQGQFRTLTKDYASSPYRTPAAFILSLMADIERLRSEADAKDEKVKRLQEELDRLKKIDMERRPPKPPE
jgi:hypothetical protein